MSDYLWLEGINSPSFLTVAVFLTLLIWSIIWKGMALWKAARLGDKKWFVFILILSTVGILDILYIYVFSKKKDLDVEI